jgi:hypothetical protein
MTSIGVMLTRCVGTTLDAVQLFGLSVECSASQYQGGSPARHGHGVGLSVLFLHLAHKCCLSRGSRECMWGLLLTALHSWLAVDSSSSWKSECPSGFTLSAELPLVVLVCDLWSKWLWLSMWCIHAFANLDCSNAICMCHFPVPTAYVG